MRTELAAVLRDLDEVRSLLGTLQMTVESVHKRLDQLLCGASQDGTSVAAGQGAAGSGHSWSVVPEQRLQVLRCLQWQEIWRLSAVSREWRETSLQWHSTPHEPRHSMKFQVPGHSCSFSCELMCDGAASEEHHDVEFSFHGLSASGSHPRFRWVWQVGNFDEDYFHESDAVGIYLEGYTNQPYWFKKLKLPGDFSVSGWHKVQLKFQIFEDADSNFGDSYSGAEIEVTIDDLPLDTGPGVGMDGTKKGKVILGRIVKGFSRQLEVLILARGPVRIRREESWGSFLPLSGAAFLDGILG